MEDFDKFFISLLSIWAGVFVVLFLLSGGEKEIMISGVASTALLIVGWLIFSIIPSAVINRRGKKRR
jgi:hypothetical protein